MDKYLKPELGKYRLSSLTSVKLNLYIVDLCNKYNYKKSYYKNILKVLKNCFRIATDKVYISYLTTVKIYVKIKKVLRVYLKNN